MSQSAPKAFGAGEGGKKVHVAKATSKARSQNICPVHLIRVAACADGVKKLLRKKRNESWMRSRSLRAKQVLLSRELEENCYAKSSSLFVGIQFVGRDIVYARAGCGKIEIGSDAESLRVNANGTQLSSQDTEAEEPIVVSATRFEIPLDQSPASASVVTSQDLEIKQTERISDALREVPGLSVVQTGTAGQLTSVFMRGLRSEHVQVLLDGIPVNQGLQGAFNFADLTVDNIDRIEVVRGPQSTIYGPRALAGVIQLFTKQGEGTPGVTVSAEGGSYDTFRESVQSDGKIDNFDYSFGASRLDTDNSRPNNEYRNTAAIADVGWSPNGQLRIGGLFTYSNSDTGNPNSIFTPKPFDNFLTERWLIAPHIDFKPVDWWSHKLIVSYDHERQVNDPNNDGFVCRDPRVIQTSHHRLPKRSQAGFVADGDQRIFSTAMSMRDRNGHLSRKFGPQLSLAIIPKKRRCFCKRR